MRFPQDFVKKSHTVVPGAVQYVYRQSVDLPEPPVNPHFISIVGGGMGLRGDGYRTFEVYDSESDYGVVLAYATEEEINEYLSQYD